MIHLIFLKRKTHFRPRESLMSTTRSQARPFSKMLLGMLLTIDDKTATMARTASGTHDYSTGKPQVQCYVHLQQAKRNSQSISLIKTIVYPSNIISHHLISICNIPVIIISASSAKKHNIYPYNQKSSNDDLKVVASWPVKNDQHRRTLRWKYESAVRLCAEEQLCGDPISRATLTVLIMWPFSMPMVVIWELHKMMKNFNSVIFHWRVIPASNTERRSYHFFTAGSHWLWWPKRRPVNRKIEDMS